MNNITRNRTKLELKCISPDYFYTRMDLAIVPSWN